MIWVNLGKEVLPEIGKDVMMRVPEYGNVLLAAQPGGGKTSLIKNICSQVSNSRILVIMDIIDREYDCLGLPNALSENPGCVERIQNIDAKRFGFSPSQLDNRDFMAMGFTPKAAIALQSLINFAEDDIDRLIELAEAIPTNRNERYDFNEKYPEVQFDGTIHELTKQNLIQSMIALSQAGFFVKPEQVKVFQSSGGTRGKALMNQEYLHELLSRGHVRFNFDLSLYDDRIAQFYIGKIMYLLRYMGVCGRCTGCRAGMDCRRPRESLVSKFHPLVIIEESDKIFPNVDSTVPGFMQPISLQEGVEWIIKLRRYGCTMITVTQKWDRISSVFKDFARCKIIGQVYGAHPAAEKLHFSPEKGIRQFIYLSTESSRYKIFEPHHLSVFDVRGDMSPYEPLKMKFRNVIDTAMLDENKSQSHFGMH